MTAIISVMMFVAPLEESFKYIGHVIITIILDEYNHNVHIYISNRQQIDNK